jgi:hypothetical protein
MTVENLSLLFTNIIFESAIQQQPAIIPSGKEQSSSGFGWFGQAKKKEQKNLSNSDLGKYEHLKNDLV